MHLFLPMRSQKDKKGRKAHTVVFYAQKKAKGKEPFAPFVISSAHRKTRLLKSVILNAYCSSSLLYFKRCAYCSFPFAPFINRRFIEGLYKKDGDYL